MLQQKEISRLLGKAVGTSPDTDTSSGEVLFASLLSSRGLPLITVGSSDVQSSGDTLSHDSLRMHSLMATKLFNQQEKTGDDTLDDWAVLELDKSMKSVMRRFSTTSSGEKEPQTTFYTVLFYSSSFADSQAKTRLDSITEVLAAGLSGYRSS